MSRIPVEDDYVRTLGRAAYNFSYLEWSIVFLMETLQPGFLAMAPNMTAGKIAAKFEGAVQNADQSKDHEDLADLAKAFRSLVDDRNKLLHGSPVTATDGTQQLLYRGRDLFKMWPLEAVAKAAEQFESVAIEANNLLHSGRLETYRKAM